MKNALSILCRAAAEVFEGDQHGELHFTQNGDAREMLKLALALSDRTPLAQVCNAPVPILDREDTDTSFWHETPVNCPPKPETIAKALAAEPPPAAGVE